MVRGFYTLGSNMLSQNKVLGTISNNIANVKTTGFKKSLVTTKTFGEMMANRVDSSVTPLSKVAMITVADEAATIHSQGNLQSTNRSLDFAIKGQGFFAVQSQNGTVYTRNGSFNIDQEGYLVLDRVGRVMGQNGPIHVGTDQFTADGQGNLIVNGQKVDKLAVYDFADYKNLKTVGEGMFNGAAAQAVQNPQIDWKTVEYSNVNMAEEMTNAIAAQRGLQSCSQAIKMYDNIIDKAVNQIGKL